MTQNQEFLVGSTETALREFKEGSVWVDILGELEKWMQMLQEAYDECNDISEVKKIQGRREAVLHILDLPDKLIEAAKEQRLKEQEERDARRV